MTRWLIYLAVVYAVYRLVRKSRRLTAAVVSNSKPSPYEVLGIGPDASEKEIKQAYQNKIQRFHPDRVANAADELQQLAEERTKQLNEAYQALMDRR